MAFSGIEIKMWNRTNYGVQSFILVGYLAAKYALFIIVKKGYVFLKKNWKNLC